MSGGMGALLFVIVAMAVVLVVVVAVAVALFVRASRGRKAPQAGAAPTPGAAPGAPVAPTTPIVPSTPIAPGAEAGAWSAAMAEAAAAPTDAASGPAGRPRETFSRDALVDPDRTLDPSKWDNRPDGSEEYDEDDPPPATGPSGGPVMDSNFFNSLRERRTDG